MTHQSDPKMWEKIYEVDDEIIWNIRQTLKNKFVKFVKDDFRETWLKNQGDPSRIVSVLEKINPNALLIGFAVVSPLIKEHTCYSQTLNDSQK